MPFLDSIRSAPLTHLPDAKRRGKHHAQRHRAPCHQMTVKSMNWLHVFYFLCHQVSFQGFGFYHHARKTHFRTTYPTAFLVTPNKRQIHLGCQTILSLTFWVRGRAKPGVLWHSLTVGLYLGSYSAPRAGGLFLMSEVSLHVPQPEVEALPSCQDPAPLPSEDGTT